MVASLTLQHLMCAGLWCLVEGDTSCKTKLDPPLDGTECGADKVTNTQLPALPASNLTSPGHRASLRLEGSTFCPGTSGIPLSTQGIPMAPTARRVSVSLLVSYEATRINHFLGTFY